VDSFCLNSLKLGDFSIFPAGMAIAVDGAWQKSLSTSNEEKQNEIDENGKKGAKRFHTD
jgi:hypothetical protein